MADKSEDIQSTEDKIILAKELYGTGCRSYLIKSYSDAVDDLSKATELFVCIYGELADELGMPYLMYAKSLIAVAQQGENKILEVPDEENEQDDDDEDEDDENEGDDKEVLNGDKPEEKDDEKESEKNGIEAEGKTNGTSNGTTTEPQPGTSSVAVADDNQEGEEEGDDADSDTPAANLQLAWEVLELAVKIFTRQGEPALSNLAEAYFELAEISFENSHFDTAVADYKSSENTRMNLPDDDLRLLSVIQYKIGLSYYMNQSFAESIEAFKKACDMIECRIETLKSKDDKSDKDTSTIAGLEEMKEEVLAKIVEIEEVKQQSAEEFKKIIAEFMGGNSKTPESSSSATESASSSASTAGSSKPKPTDISHLIKRKKPDAVPSDDEVGPVTKKPSL